MRHHSIKIGLIIVLIALVLPIEICPAEGITHNVNIDGSADYTSIQDAVNAASGRDIIFVYSGTYFENVIVNKSIDLIGEDINTTIIDGGNNGVVINISAQKVNISGFSIMHDSTGGSSAYPAGVYISRNSDWSIISGNMILDCVNGIISNSNNEYSLSSF